MQTSHFIVGALKTLEIFKEIVFNPITITLAAVWVLWLLAVRFGSNQTDIEHGIYCYCGRLGQGKTYALVRDVVKALNNGQVVYTNFTIYWNGYDERQNLFSIVLALFGLKSKFVQYPASNLRILPTDEKWHETFGTLKDCIVAIDEAYVLFDSYQMSKMPMSQRLNILQTRKFNRSIWYTTQRPTSVHAVMRGMTNVFYKCEKMYVPFLTLFARDEYDLASDETLDDENRLSRKIYIGKKEYFTMYNTKETVGIRGELSNIGIPESETETRIINVIRPWHVIGALAPKRASKANFEPSTYGPRPKKVSIKERMKDA